MTKYLLLILLLSSCASEQTIAYDKARYEANPNYQTDDINHAYSYKGKDRDTAGYFACLMRYSSRFNQSDSRFICEQLTNNTKQLDNHWWLFYLVLDMQRIRGRALQTLRAKHFRANPLCVHCHAKGIITLATELDHIIALNNKGTNADSNLQGLCAECHKVKTVIDLGYTQRKTIGIDG